MHRQLNIGEAAEAAGVSAKMIRHYEQIGLLPAAARTDSGYRQYGERDVSILRFIRQSRQLGFSIERIAELLGLWSRQDRPSRDVKALAQAHLDELQRKMLELAQMQEALAALVGRCQGDDAPHCSILAGLAASSPEAPEPGAVGGKPLRRPVAKAGAARGAAKVEARAESATHLDLMAWTRHLHTPGHH
ncbi:Cu(I)-responsive transcriptional regulator [uncultured Piscinibacter sp.]|uniref:Cu(I)-responsive transcriptional regulator n=1 Tax=uncultured Piscinibacter sp. TaxID=1131835 RepID=UPI00345C01D7